MSRENRYRWDDGLIGPARRIAELDHTPMRVMAGPGTGKTSALMRRVARLLEDGATPGRILVCTFTRTAARDLQRELARLGLAGANRVRAGTLHAFCFGILGRAEVLIATGRVPRPLLHFEERFLLQDLNGDGFGGVYDRDRRLQAFNAAWARLQSEDPGWPTDPIDLAFHRALARWLRFHQAMLIGELVPETLRYLRENPASPHRGVFEHVLVDEYQDLNRAEQDLLDLLAESGNILVIGDEDQSIYSFKFAHPDGIATFDDTHPDTHDEGLDDCHRCPRSVIEMANALIANNPDRTPRTLQPLPGNPEGEVLVLQWHTVEDEAQGIAELIRRRVESGEVEAGRVLVLAPRRQLGYAIRDALNSVGVLAQSFFHEEALDGNPKELDECGAQQAFTLLTLLANPDDSVALRCWCGFGSSSLRVGAWARLREHCGSSGETPLASLERLASGDLSIPHTGSLVLRFQELERRLEELGHVRGQALVDSLFPLEQEWTHLVRYLASRMEGDELSAQELREHLRIGITQPELPTDVDYVRVMSLHKSKGLTADLVAVVGCIEGLIPNVYDPRKTILTQEQFECEQRRLFYVAMTRTRRMLILSTVAQLERGLAHRMRARVGVGDRTHAATIASRFLSELGPRRPIAVLGSTVLEGEPL